MEEFNRLLNEYKNQYLQFLATGNSQFRNAYETVMRSIEETIQRKREQVDSQKSAMKHFVRTYKKDNDDIAGMVDSTSSLAKTSMQAHDEYLTSKDRYDTWTTDPSAPKKPVVDVANGYAIMLRFGIFLILIPVLIFIGWLGSGYMSSSSMAPGSINITQSPFFGPSAIHNR